MSNGLQNVINYMIPAVGTPRAYVWSGTLGADTVTVDFRGIEGGMIDGQPFRPSGVFIDNTQGTSNLTVVVNEISYQMICVAGGLLNLQFPAPVELSVTFSGTGPATLVFVDFPVLPFNNQIGSFISGINVLDEGAVIVSSADLINFVGDGVVVSDVGGVPTVTIPGGGGDITGVDVEDEGSSVVASATTFNFTGAGVSVSDVAGVATVDIPGGGGISGIQIQDEGLVVLASTTSLNFVGAGVTATNVGGVGTITIPGGGGGSGIDVEDEGSTIVSAATSINFTGAGVSVTDIGGTPTVDIPGGGGASVEQGTFTPTITFDIPGDLSVSYDVQEGTYVKIGNMVWCTFEIITSSFTHSTSGGNFRIQGFPYSGASVGIGELEFEGITKAGYTSFNVYKGSGTTASISASGSGQASTSVGAADMPSGGSIYMVGNVFYLNA